MSETSLYAFQLESHVNSLFLIGGSLGALVVGIGIAYIVSQSFKRRKNDRR